MVTYIKDTEELKIGDFIRIFATNLLCNRSLHNCEGIVTKIKGTRIQLSIKTGSLQGSNVGFTISPEYWGYILLCGDWDN